MTATLSTRQICALVLFTAFLAVCRGASLGRRSLKELRELREISALETLVARLLHKRQYEVADTIMKNGVIYTGDKQSTIAEAVAMRDGQIIFVGSSYDVEEFADASTQVVDLKGSVVLPGFIDNHCHVFEALSPAAATCEIASDVKLSEQHASLLDCWYQYINAKPGDWVKGSGWDIENLLEGYDTADTSQQTPRAMLDEYFPDNPAVLMERTSHAVWVNTKALEAVGFHDNTPDPVGGRIIRDDNGKANGILYDNAGDVVLEKAWNAAPDRDKLNHDGLVAGLNELAKSGITTVGDGRMYWRRGWLDTWKKVEKEGKLTARAVVRPWVYPDLDLNTQLDEFYNMHRGSTDSRLLINQVKMYSDGIIINSSAKSLTKYIFSWFPSPKYDHGLNYISEDKMKNVLEELDKIGYGAMIHVIGDGAAQESLNAIADARSRRSNQKYILTHVEMLDDADVNRFKALDVTADFQVGPYKNDPHHESIRGYLGEGATHKGLPLKKVLATGANVLLSSDWDVNVLSPLINMADALNLKSFSNVEDAIAAYTINPAWALGLDHVTGSIEVGKSADFAVLDLTDVSQLNQAGFRKAKVLETWLEGEIVHSL